MSKHFSEFGSHRSALLHLIQNSSVEITVKDASQLERAQNILAPGTPISIACLPNEAREARLSAIRAVMAAGFRPVPHIAVRRFESRDLIDTYLGDLAAIGAAKELFVVAGDCPEGSPFADSLEFLKSDSLDRYGVETVLIAGYPDGHPRIAKDVLARALSEKTALLQAQGRKVQILTQFGFDYRPVTSWLADLRASGITAPVRLGVPGPVNAARLVRFAARCGVSASKSALGKYGLSLTKLMQPTGPDRFINALGETLSPELHGDVGLHFYPFGGFVETAAWMRAFAQMASIGEKV